MLTQATVMKLTAARGVQCHCQPHRQTVGRAKLLHTSLSPLSSGVIVVGCKLRATQGRSRSRSRFVAAPSATLLQAAPPAAVAPPRTSLTAALEAIRHGQPICILDDATREGECDLFYPAISTDAAALRHLRLQAGGELFIAVGDEVAAAFGLPFVGSALQEAAASYPVLRVMAKDAGGMCQGTCSVSLSLDHRSTKTGAPDEERSWTCRRLAQMAAEALAAPTADVAAATAALGEEFHMPGHIFMCNEHAGGLAVRRGHTELSVALAREAGVVPVMVGCVMLSNSGASYGALSPDAARAWAEEHDVPFLDGPEIAAAMGFDSTL